MKAFILAIGVSLVLAVGASFVLDTFQKPVDIAFSSATGVRL
jgi:hypothetical protein